MRKTLKRWLAAMLSAILLLFFDTAFAAVTVTAATGGTSISADTTGGAWTALTGPSIAETTAGSIDTGTIILSVPPGFLFNTGSTVTATVTCAGTGRDLLLSSTTATLTSTTIAITVTRTSNNSRLCTIDYTGIQVQPTAGSPLASGLITNSGTSVGPPSPGSYGQLTEVVGAASQLGFSIQPGNTAAGCPSALNDIAGPPTVVIQDQFGNALGAGSQSISMAIGTNPSGGTLTGTTSVTASAGVAAFSQLRIDKAGTGYTLITSSAGLTSATSNAFNITVDAWSGFLVQASGGGNIGTQSQGTAFNIQVAAVDACLNTVTTYVSNATISSSCTLFAGSGATPNFTAGVLNPWSVTVSSSGTCTITAASGAISGTSNSFTVNPFIAPAGSYFDVVEVGAAPATSIFTKVSAQAYSVDVLALDSGGSVHASFFGSVSAEIVDSSGGTCATMGQIASLPNQTFSGSGRLTMSVSAAAVTNAWKNARFRIKYPAASPTITGCSSDNFAIRPASITLGSADATWTTAGTGRALSNTAATGGNVHAAGRPFTLTVSPQPATATNYDTTSFTVTTGYPSCNLPGSCTLGTLSLGAFGAAGSGVQASSTAGYTEVGAINLQLEDDNFAAVDAGDTAGSCTSPPTPNRYVCSTAAIPIGRFVPDHFDVSTANTPQFRTFGAGCAGTRSFTYIGQLFNYATRPQATILARNAAGATTANYAGTLWKIGGAAPATAKDCLASPDPDTCQFTTSWAAGGNSSDVVERYTYALTPASTPNWDDAGATAAAASVAAGAGTGTITYASSDALAFLRSTTPPQATFTANITNTVSVQDTSEVAVAGNGTITTTTAAAFSNIAFDSGNEFRYGRLQFLNAHGSGLLALDVPIQVEYWNGTLWLRNAADNCTSVGPANIALGNVTTVPPVPPLSTSASGGGTVSGGGGSITLAKPTGGTSGTVDVTLNLGVTGTANAAPCPAWAPAPAATALNAPYLQSQCAGAGAYSRDPSARATFGIYRNKFILLRENY